MNDYAVSSALHDDADAMLEWVRVRAPPAPQA